MKTTMKSLVAVTFIAGLIAGCTHKDRDASQEIVRPLSDSEVILEYSGGKITAGDVREKMSGHLEHARDELFNDYLMAAREALFERSRSQKETPDQKVTDYELESYMKANKIPDSEKEKIRVFLENEKRRLAVEDEKQNLFKSLNVRNRLGTANFEVPDSGHLPQFGSPKAKVTVEMFCDFANPNCNRVRMVMAATKNTYGDKIRWVYRFFPVPSNAGSYEAAIAALCAHDQGQFWLAHDRLLDLGPTLAKKDLTEVIAKIPGIDADKLRACQKSADAKSRINNEVKEATSLGLTMTPTFFVNGARTGEVDEVAPLVDAQFKK